MNRYEFYATFISIFIFIFIYFDYLIWIAVSSFNPHLFLNFSRRIRKQIYTRILFLMHFFFFLPHHPPPFFSFLYTFLFFLFFLFFQHFFYFHLSRMGFNESWRRRKYFSFWRRYDHFRYFFARWKNWEPMYILE